MTFLLAYLNVNFNFTIFVYGSWICIFLWIHLEKGVLIIRLRAVAIVEFVCQRSVSGCGGSRTNVCHTSPAHTDRCVTSWVSWVFECVEFWESVECWVQICLVELGSCADGFVGVLWVLCCLYYLYYLLVLLQFTYKNLCVTL